MKNIQVLAVALCSSLLIEFSSFVTTYDQLINFFFQFTLWFLSAFYLLRKTKKLNNENTNRLDNK